MNIGKIKIIDNVAKVVDRRVITSGMIGATVDFSFDATWAGCSKTYVWRAGRVVKDDATASGVVPPEVLETPKVILYVGVYGVKGDEVTPTVWASLGTIMPGADPSGDETTDPTPPVWAQLKAEAEAAAQSAHEDRMAAEVAANATQVYYAQADVAAKSAAGAAMSAEASAQAARMAQAATETAQIRTEVAQSEVEDVQRIIESLHNSTLEACASTHTTKGEAEAAATQAGKAQESAETAQAKAETAQAKAEGAQAKAEAAQGAAEVAKTSAAESATNAAEAADRAETAASTKAWRAETANALVGDVAGAAVRVDDISPLEHEPAVVVSGVADPSAVTLKKYGKNLLPYPFYASTIERNGVTFTDNGDGTVTVNGTASTFASFSLAHPGYPIHLPKGVELTLTGVPDGIAKNDCYIVLRTKDKVQSITDFGGGASMVTEYTDYECFVAVATGRTVNNIVVKPQIEVGGASAWEPYVEPTSYKVAADGTVAGGELPPDECSTLLTDTEGAVVRCTYNRDANKVIERLVNAIISLGGNV